MDERTDRPCGKVEAMVARGVPRAYARMIVDLYENVLKGYEASGGEGGPLILTAGHDEGGGYDPSKPGEKVRHDLIAAARHLFPQNRPENFHSMRLDDLSGLVANTLHLRGGDVSQERERADELEKLLKAERDAHERLVAKLAEALGYPTDEDGDPELGVKTLGDLVGEACDTIECLEAARTDLGALLNLDNHTLTSLVNIAGQVISHLRRENNTLSAQVRAYENRTREAPPDVNDRVVPYETWAQKAEDAARAFEVVHLARRLKKSLGLVSGEIDIKGLVEEACGRIDRQLDVVRGLERQIADLDNRNKFLDEMCSNGSRSDYRVRETLNLALGHGTEEEPNLGLRDAEDIAREAADRIKSLEVEAAELRTREAEASARADRLGKALAAVLDGAANALLKERVIKGFRVDYRVGP